MSHDYDIAKLNELLRGELAAVETYEQCIERVEDVSLHSKLSNLCLSHRERIDRLRATITQLGGEPDQSSGPWGTMARLIENTAGVFGKRAAVSALIEGEEHGEKQYRETDDLSPEVRRLVGEELWADQRRTMEMLRLVGDTMHAG